MDRGKLPPAPGPDVPRRALENRQPAAPLSAPCTFLNDFGAVLSRGVGQAAGSHQLPPVSSNTWGGLVPPRRSAIDECPVGSLAPLMRQYRDRQASLARPLDSADRRRFVLKLEIS